MTGKGHGVARSAGLPYTVIRTYGFGETAMLTSKDLLAAVRAAQGIPSNYRLARLLDVPEKTVQRWNTCANAPDDAMALRLAELARLDAAEVLAAMYAQRAADGPMAGVWRSIAERLQGAAVAVLVAVLSLFVGGGPDAGAQASPVKHVANVSGMQQGLYIM